MLRQIHSDVLQHIEHFKFPGCVCDPVVGKKEKWSEAWLFVIAASVADPVNEVEIVPFVRKHCSGPRCIVKCSGRDAQWPSQLQVTIKAHAVGRERQRPLSILHADVDIQSGRDETLSGTQAYFFQFVPFISENIADD